LKSGSKYVAVNSGDFTNISVYVKTSTASDGTEYSGNSPRLILRRNPSIGVYNNIVLDELTSNKNVSQTFVELKGTTPTAISDGVFEFYVDCDGSNGGWINTDNWSSN
jgi:hypothetical protein